MWRDKRDVHMLINIHSPPAEGNFCDEKWNAGKTLIVEDYNRHMGYVDKGDRMANSYTISHRIWKWTKKLFFYLLDLNILNSYILSASFGRNKITHREFRLGLVRDMSAHAGQQPRIQKPLDRPASVESNVGRLDSSSKTTIGRFHLIVFAVPRMFSSQDYAKGECEVQEM
ncbi:hypothetical protein ANN_06517 [Periplaneta americana]|uniref:PiggyBac transposable element-derived protein domain-containing protein n=1 Tax=Periplaneta americana TaxID=6978 RepID=A0ABQ8TG96_PERAM|nr:hypothetical protein ANN_06517 [Periplaneta americana]